MPKVWVQTEKLTPKISVLIKSTQKISIPDQKSTPQKVSCPRQQYNGSYPQELSATKIPASPQNSNTKDDISLPFSNVRLYNKQ